MKQLIRLGLSLWLVLAGPFNSAVADTYLEEITVTAQKREQSIQDIAVAVTALTDETIAESGIQTIEDIQALAPSLTVTSVNIPGSSTQIQIRGVGTSTTNVGLESAVGFFLDGVYRSRSGTAVGDLLDVERIEILRGPQSSVFGKNTSAGAISVISKKPVFEREGWLQLDSGNYDALRVQGVYNQPLSDTLSLRLSASSNQRDGYVDDIVTGDDYNNLDRWSSRLQLLWRPNQKLSARVIADWSGSDETSVVGVRKVNGPLDSSLFAGFAAANGSVIVIPADPEELETALNDGADTDVDDSGFSIEVNYSIPAADFTFITSWREYESFSNKDVDHAAVDFFRTEFDFSQEYLSLELRAIGDIELADDASLDWLAGVFYADEEIRSHVRFPTQGQLPLMLSITAAGFGLPLAPSDFANGEDTGLDYTGVVEGKTLAAFAQSTYNFNTKYGVTLGLRYTDEEKDNTLVDDTIAGPGNVLLNLFAPAPGFNDLEISDDVVTGDISFHVNWTDDVMTYLKYSEGYKAGGMNINAGGAGSFFAPADPSFDPETSEGFELGFRSRLANGKSTLNITAFDTDFEDFQVQSFDGINFLLTNVEGVTSRGVELEFRYQPDQYWFFAGGFTYADATFDDGVNTGFADVGGEQLPLSSEWTGSVTVGYERPLGNTGLFGKAHLEILGRSESNLDTGTLDPAGEQSGYGLVNLRLSVGSEDDRWRAALFCRNCGDKHYSIFTFASSLQPGSFDTIVGQPRMWGLSLQARL